MKVLRRLTNEFKVIGLGILVLAYCVLAVAVGWLSMSLLVDIF